MPPIGSFIEVDGTRLHYLDEGAGQPIVLVHGLAAQMQHLTYALRDRLRGKYRVIFVDRPGAGYSDRKPGASARLPAQGDMIAALIRTLGAGSPARRRPFARRRRLARGRTRPSGKRRRAWRSSRRSPTRRRTCRRH